MQDPPPRSTREVHPAGRSSTPGDVVETCDQAQAFAPADLSAAMASFSSFRSVHPLGPSNINLAREKGIA